MQLVIRPGGAVQCVYSEELDLHALGSPAIRRASHVEPDENGRWIADLSPAGGPVLRGFERRSEAIRAETCWLEEQLLLPTS